MITFEGRQVINLRQWTYWYQVGQVAVYWAIAFDGR